MPEQFERIQPGDLITADFMNRLLAALEGLDGRVTTLEEGSGIGTALRILGITPSGPAQMGQELCVLGVNFGLPALDVVVIDTVAVTQFKAGSNGSQLLFDVPAIPNTPPQGKPVTLSVSGPNGFDSREIVVVPAQPTVPQGQLILNLLQSPPEPIIQNGQSYVFGFRIRAITNLEETYTVSPTAQGLQPGWQAILVDEQNTPIIPAEVTLAAGPPPNGVTRDVRVRVTVPAGGTTANLRLALASKRNPSGLNNATGNIALTVGQAPPVASDDIILRRDSVEAPAVVENGAVVLPPTGVMGAVVFRATIKAPGAYQVEPLVIQNDAGNRWNTLLGLSSPGFTTTGQNADVTIPVGLSAEAGAAATNLILRVRSQSNANIVGEISQPIRATGGQ